MNGHSHKSNERIASNQNSARHRKSSSHWLLRERGHLYRALIGPWAVSRSKSAGDVTSPLFDTLGLILFIIFPLLSALKSIFVTQYIFNNFVKHFFTASESSVAQLLSVIVQCIDFSNCAPARAIMRGAAESRSAGIFQT